MFVEIKFMCKFLKSYCRLGIVKDNTIPIQLPVLANHISLTAIYIDIEPSGLPRSRPGFNSRSEHMTGSDSSIIGGPDSGKFVCPCRQ